jgi:hypothetical protein
MGKSYYTLEQNLDLLRCGSKASNLSILQRNGFNVPQGWVLPVGLMVKRSCVHFPSMP